MATTKKLMGTTAVGGALAIEDVFSTYLYRGATTNPTDIVNGIDLAGEGGMVWVKVRNTARAGVILDTHNGATKYLETDRTDAIQTFSAGYGFDGFTSTGVSSAANGNVQVNSTYNYASWTFRKAPRFFDVVTYTGDGVAGRTVSHNLGVEPGCIIVKAVSGTYATRAWQVYHRGLDATSPEDKYLVLNTTAAVGDATNFWNDTAPTSTEFTLGTWTGGNGTGTTYVAYLFAHDPLGPSGDGSDGLIACGSYTGDGTTNGTNEVTLGWEPQWILTKRSDSVDNWHICDVMRGQTTDGITQRLIANTNAAESASYGAVPTPTGFKLYSDNSSGGTYIYIAIRRGPMRQPESGTEVFAVNTAGSSSEPRAVSSFPVDMAFRTDPTQTQVRSISARLTQGQFMKTNATDAEAATTNFEFDYNNGVSSLLLSSYYYWMFRRAPGFFDVVAYTGDGVAGRTVPHNLGVAPEMMIVKRRNTSSGWNIYHSFNTATKKHYFSTGASFSTSDTWNNTEPSDAVFTLGTNIEVNGSGSTYIAYLFATLPGVSKVGSYTGNGTSQTIDCGFTSGARFVLIKRTDSTGDWYVWDTARGIVAANDPHLSLNTPAAEVTTDDSVDPDSSGFIVNQVSATNINVNAASYIFYAIA